MPALLVKINVDDKGNVAIEKLSKNASKAQPKVKSLGDTMRKAFAVVGVYKGINLLTAKLTQATDEALKFEKAMKKIKAIGNESGKTMQVMGKDIEKLALTTEHSFTQIAEAQLGISKAGIRGAEGLEVLKHALDLATVAGEEQGAVSEGLINILNAFGMGTEDAGYAANVMSRALNETILNLEEYLEAMKYSAPVASQLGVSFEELSAIIGILAQTGQRGSLAGTGLRNVLLNMLKLTPETAKSLEKVKIEEMGVTQLLETLHENGLPVVDLLKQFNKRGILAATALGKNAEAVYELQSRLTDLSRPLDQVASEMRDNLLDKLQMVNDHFVAIFNTLNEKMGSGGDTVLDNLTAKLVDFNQLLKDNPQVIRDWTAVFVGLGNTLTSLVPIMGFMIEHSRELLAIWATAKVGTGVAETVIAFKKFKGIVKTIPWNPVAAGIMGLTVPLITVAAKAWDANKELGELKKTAEKFGRGEAEILPSQEVIKSMALDLNKSYAEFMKSVSETEQKYLLGTVDIDKIAQISETVKTEAKRIWDLEDSLEVKTGKTFSDNFEKKMEQIAKLTGAYEGFIQKAKKAETVNPYGSNLTVKEKKTKKKKEHDDTLGQLFDLTSAEHVYALSERIDEANNKAVIFTDTIRNLQANIAGLAYPIDMESNLDTSDTINKIFEEQTRWLEKFKEKDFNPLAGVENFAEDYSNILSIVNPITDTIGSRIDYLHERQMQIYDEEMEKLQERYDLEIEAAGDSALQKSLAENKYQKEKEKLEAKANEENKKYAQKQWLADMAQIALNSPVMATNFIVSLSKYLGPAAIPAGIALAAGVTGLQLGIAAANNPADAFVRGGRVNGNGNSTSDSVYARLSVGEHVLSRDDVERLGGDSAVERMITRGANSTGTSTTIYIDSVIGEESYVRRNIIPCIREELKR